MSLPTSAEQDVARHLKAIEEIRATAFRKELEKEIQKRVSDDELYVSAKAFCQNYILGKRQAILKVARSQKKENKKEVTVASPIS